MGNQKTLFIILGIVAVGVVGFVLASGSKAPQEPNADQTKEQKSSDTQGKQNAQDANSQALSVRYLSYSEENLALATQDNGRAVIFFHAGWCPSCRAAEADFKANFEKVPLDVTILKTDYDASTDLKQKYNIATQDTFVQVDSTGAEITKWNSGGEGLKALLANIKSLLGFYSPQLAARSLIQ